jgi:hypothetical protein
MPTQWLSSTLWLSSTQWVTNETGVTIYEVILSIDENNMPITNATFETAVYKNGQLSNIQLYLTSINAQTGAFVAYFYADELDIYQFSIRNLVTDVRYVSKVFRLTSTITENFTVFVEPPRDL